MTTTPSAALSETGFGTYRFKVGDSTVISAWDGFNPMQLKDNFIRNAAFDEVQACLQAQFLPRDTLNISFTPFVIQTGGETILFDTGFGGAGPASAGNMLRNLERVGITAEAVTKIVFSHFHGDHINGLRAADGSIAFPNAKLLVPAVEWEFWTNQEHYDQTPEAGRRPFDLVRKIFAGTEDRLTCFAWDSEVAPGIRALDAKGHTPGHTAFVLTSGENRLLMISDVTNHPALFMTNPDWEPAFDMDPAEARKTRHRILSLAASEKIRITGYHLPFPATGYVEQTATGFKFVPAQWLDGV